MNERDALFRAVCENPDDDTPRLVFADWLQEHGEDARAEFIRVQVESERYDLNGDQGLAAFFRERELLFDHERDWRGELPQCVAAEPFIRGFVESATVKVEHLTDTADLEALFAATPLVELTITSLPDPGMLALVPEVSRLRKLTLTLWEVPEESLRVFLTRVDLRGLKSLTAYASDEVCSRLRGRFQGIFVRGRLWRD